jgi:hypothetical protein
LVVRGIYRWRRSQPTDCPDEVTDQFGRSSPACEVFCCLPAGNSLD